MKKLIALCLAIAMVLSLTACGCKHPSTEMKLADINTSTLTAKWHTICTECGKVVEKRDAATGVPPQDGVFWLSAQEWYNCLIANLTAYDTGRLLAPMDVSAEDGAQLYAVVSTSGMKSVISFYDKNDQVITTAQAGEQQLVHRICVEAQFENDTAQAFYSLLLLMAITNNSSWDNTAVNDLCQKIMGRQPVSDNGYSYSLEILSTATHTVALNIVAE